MRFDDEFSVVIPVYAGDSAEHFKDAVHSVLNQTISPKEVIIVVDGPLPSSLENIVNNFNGLDNSIVMRQSTNVGAGKARDLGIRRANSGLIALMDADDISVANRFELQLEYLKENIDTQLVGGVIREFDEVLGDTKRLRCVPIKFEDIISEGRWRQPFNNVTVMFRKSAYLSVGGYRKIPYVEDYDFYHRILLSEIRCANLPEILVEVRTGQDLIRKRRGRDYLFAEILLLNRMRVSGYITYTQWLLGVVARSIARLTPRKISEFLYRNTLRQTVEDKKTA